MIIVLSVLSGLLVLAGAAAVVNGWDIVLNERGWSQVIAGATVVAGGFLLMGMTCIVTELRRLRREIAAVGSDIPDEEVSLLPAAPPMAQAMQPGPPPPVPEPLVASRDDRIAPRPLHSEQAAPQQALVERGGAPDAPPPLAPQEPPPAPEVNASALDVPMVVGTYASAGITYFMYSDHSIEADMEQGRYRFDSMDDLRRFLETGEGGMLIESAGERAPMAT